MNATLFPSDGIPAYELVFEDDKSILYQTDWDYPGLARDLGWNMASLECEHSGTDGTVNCLDCGKTATEFINEAGNYLEEHLYETFDVNDELYEVAE